MAEKPFDSWRARAAVSEALDVFNSSYMQDVWSKAIARRETDPGGAVTSARTLLETVCKHILSSADRTIHKGASLPQLYAETAKVLDMAPSQNLEPIFDSLFTACTEVVTCIGRLRNDLSDSHGHDPFGALPDWRHAELAVHLSGAMATYLAAVWKARQPTVYDVVQSYLEERQDSLSRGTRYELARMTDDLRDLVASKLTAGDLVTYFEDRAVNGPLKPNTVKRLFLIFRHAVGGLSAEAFLEAGEILRHGNRFPSGFVPMFQRVAHEDFEALVDYFRDRRKMETGRKHKATHAGMDDVIEFAIWSGRRPKEIVTLRWDDVDFEKRTCKLPGKTGAFPVFERAWGIIEERRSNPLEPNGRIFPYSREVVSIQHTSAVKALFAAGKIKSHPRFHDYRYEAAHRLLERRHAPQVVARATGQPAGMVFKIAEQMQAETEI